MGNKKLFSHDPLTGITKYWHDNQDGTVTLESDQDVSAIMAENQFGRKEIDKHAKWGDMSRVASIPLTVYYDLKQKGILDDQVALRKWLNDPDNELFRTRKGKV